MRYLVFGTGAVGALVGGKLALAGFPVTFLARPRIAEALQTHGLHLSGDRTHGVVEEVHAITEISGMERPDLILLTVKTYYVETAATEIETAFTEPPTIVCLCNGIGSEQILAERFGAERVISATLTTAVQMIEPAVIDVTRRRGIGVVLDHPLASEFIEDLEAADFLAEAYANATRMKWSKLLTNIVANASSAILGWTPSQVYSHPSIAQIEIESLRETVRVLRSNGFTPQDLPGVSVSLLARAIFLPKWLIRPLLGKIVSGGRGDKKPSLHFDIGRGKSEVLRLNGAVVQAGSRLGSPTPANRLLTDTLMKLVNNQEAPERFRNNPELLIQLARDYDVPGI
ncbi:MAG TPA: 2-dehydropantoate 2-reductase [Anaerolineales bacterium]|nr:2-dehydropantoate 2-reductase [Anaerolineales bacterium]